MRLNYFLSPPRGRERERERDKKRNPTTEGCAAITKSLEGYH